MPTTRCETHGPQPVAETCAHLQAALDHGARPVHHWMGRVAICSDCAERFPAVVGLERSTDDLAHPVWGAFERAYAELDGTHTWCSACLDARLA